MYGAITNIYGDMAKRAATSQLTADNWQEEDDDDNNEAEEAGGFDKASEAEMRARLIKKAKRTTGNMSTGGLFSGVKLTGSVNIGVNGAPLGAPVKSSTEEDYLHQLECLNNSVSDWIAQHVRHNPLVDLTPIFRDYEMYLAALDKNRNSNVTSATMTTTTMATKQVTPALTDAFVTANTNKAGLVASSRVGSDNCDVDVTTTTVATSGEGLSQAASDEDDAPIIVAPKPPADQPIKDEDSLLALRCKLFYKKDDSYIELGLGVLRVKEDHNKAILLMRNDTQLGNILLNISLSPQLPVSRAGKNNVLLMCPPNPPLNIKPTNQNEQEQSSEGGVVTYLIRVKTTTLADQLYNLVKQLQAKLT